MGGLEAFGWFFNGFNRRGDVLKMNKKEISHIRRQFKPENEHLTIDDIFTVYVQKETGDIYHHETNPFNMLEKETQDLFLDNFKKTLTGTVDAKLFTLKFKREEGIDNLTQNILYEGLHTKDKDEWQNHMLEIVEKIYAEKVYDFDTVVTFIQGDYSKPVHKRESESDMGGNDTVYSNKFILCSVNKTDQPESSFTFDYIEKAFKASHDVDPIINLTKPLTGFLFPAFHDYASDVNHILYSAGKANEPDEAFIDAILECDVVMTAAENKDSFELVVNKLAGDKVNATMLSNIYEEIDQILEESKEDEDSEVPDLDYNDVEHILSVSGVEDVDTEKVKETFQTIFDDEQHAFKADSLLPKKVKINTETTKISIDPKHLKDVKYITYEGKRCLLLEIGDDVEIEGFVLDSTP